tara:strand:- start:557 stop:865 length:309 start_codon:yes stop_codon:yes gene_type:complete
MIFKNIKQADEYHKYPMSYRMGSIYDDKGIIRIYSNGEKGDYETPKFFYYKLKNDKIGNRFKQNIKNKKRVRLIIKIDEGVKDRGLLEVKGFYNGFVRLGKV